VNPGRIVPNFGRYRMVSGDPSPLPEPWLRWYAAHAMTLYSRFHLGVGGGLSSWIAWVFVAGCGSANSGDLFDSPPAGTGGSYAGSGTAGGATTVTTGGSGGTATVATGGSSSGLAGAGGAAGSSTEPGAEDAGTGGSPSPECLVGTYSGAWTGQYSRGQLQTTTMGTVELTIDASGGVTGVWIGTSLLESTANVVGSIDCATGALTARIEDGSYSSGFPFQVSGTFAGQLDGTLDPTSGSFTDGVWSVSEPNAIDGGSGTWTAS
jgi:hypothetical protein